MRRNHWLMICRDSRAAVMCLLLLAGFVWTVHADAESIAPDWQGNYYYTAGNRHAHVPFTMHLQIDGQTISGRTTEPATFGDGSSAELYADISGRISGTALTFTKTYDGTGGVNHSVQYLGTISANGARMSGSWNIGDFGGSFRATPVR